MKTENVASPEELIKLLRQVEARWPKSSKLMLYANGNCIYLHDGHPCDGGRELAVFDIPNDGGGDP